LETIGQPESKEILMQGGSKMEEEKSEIAMGMMDTVNRFKV